MAIHKKYFPILILTLLLIACNNNEKDSTDKKYFDLENYFHQQAISLNSRHVDAKKILMKDNKTETQTFHQVNWQKELKPFMDADINKPGWRNSYIVDSIREQNLFNLIYVARDSSLPIRKISITEIADRPTHVTVYSSSKNNFYDLNTEMIYDADKGYTIKSSQKVRFVQQTNFVINTEFLSAIPSTN